MDFMERALDLAEEAAGGVAPRPPVGAVIVDADGQTIVGEGATQPSPGPHAEAVAIGIAGDAAARSTARSNRTKVTSQHHPAPKPSSTPESNTSSALLSTLIRRLLAAVSENSEKQGSGSPTTLMNPPLCVPRNSSKGSPNTSTPVCPS